MHLGSVIHLLGLLLMFLAGSMLLPIPFSLYYGDADLPALVISAAITLAFGFLAFKTTRFKQDLRAKEGFAVVTLGWLIFSLFGSLPYLLSGVVTSFTDAYFETMSGFTTTGASILTEIDGLPHGILFWRSLTQWIGGMGIIVFSLAILPFLGVGGMQLFKAEVPGPVADKLTPRITETAKILWGTYVLISAAEAVLLLLGGLSLFDALNQAFATMATGGFSTRTASIAAFDSVYVDYVIVLFMLLAGTNFSLHYRFLRGEFRVYWQNTEFKYFLSIVAIATVLVGISNYFNIYESIPVTVQKTVFQVVSIQTTTGFATADYELWSSSAQFVLFILMFVGGSAGSTAGGMKVIRIHLIVKFVLSEITRLAHPHAVVPVRLRKIAVPRDVVTNVLGFFVLGILVFMVGVFLLTVIGLDLATSLGAIAATLWNIGPGFGSVGPTDNYAFIPVTGKWLLSFYMLMGRLELFTVIILFTPSYWRK
jgi:trk system potassium uptake protein TrkH